MWRISAVYFAEGQLISSSLYLTDLSQTLQVLKWIDGNVPFVAHQARCFSTGFIGRKHRPLHWSDALPQQIQAKHKT